MMCGFSCPTTASCQTICNFHLNPSGRDMQCLRVFLSTRQFYRVVRFLCTSLHMVPSQDVTFTLGQKKTGGSPCFPMVQLSLPGTTGSHRLFTATTGTLA